MGRSAVKHVVGDELAKADIQVNGVRPWDIQIYNERFYDKVLAEGSMGLGESYMAGWWESDAVDEFIHRLLRADGNRRYMSNLSLLWRYLEATFFNLQTKKRSLIVGEHHYDLGNDLFEAMLDKNMAYSCAYWKEAATLDEAQEAKFDLICRKIGLKKGMRVLDIGSGWGGFSRWAAEKYGAEVVGITISKEQAELAAKRCAGLPVEVRFQDYRDVSETFDRIVSVGQFEHVGEKNYRTYFEVCRRCLKDDGLMLLHTIGGNATARVGDPWIRKYIFPNGHIPSVREIGEAMEGYFIMEDWHNFGADYDRTLMAWYHNFNHSWPKLQEHYGDSFYRMWSYYLKACAGAFRARNIQLWQLVLSTTERQGGYISHR